MKNVPQDRLLSISALEPPSYEQRRIAKILRTWDEAIEKTERLTAAKMSLFKKRREEPARQSLRIASRSARPKLGSSWSGS
jgi:type I restriction enzyme S subunit